MAVFSFRGLIQNQTPPCVICSGGSQCVPGDTDCLFLVPGPLPFPTQPALLIPFLFLLLPLTVRNPGDFPGGPVVDSMLPVQGVWVPSLVGELRSHVLCSVAKKIYIKKKKSPVLFTLFLASLADWKSPGRLGTHHVCVNCSVRLFVAPWAVACQASLSTSTLGTAECVSVLRAELDGSAARSRGLSETPGLPESPAVWAVQAACLLEQLLSYWEKHPVPGRMVYELCG